MVIVNIAGGLGNQFKQYAAGRFLAYKLNTELKLDIARHNVPIEFKKRSHDYYRLEAFNILENFATPEEIKEVREGGGDNY